MAKELLCFNELFEQTYKENFIYTDSNDKTYEYDIEGYLNFLYEQGFTACGNSIIYDVSLAFKKDNISVLLTLNPNQTGEETFMVIVSCSVEDGKGEDNATLL